MYSAIFCILFHTSPFQIMFVNTDYFMLFFELFLIFLFEVAESWGCCFAVRSSFVGKAHQLTIDLAESLLPPSQVVRYGCCTQS